jgi:hypothetical protein
LTPLVASATAQRTFVASTGSDANSCSLAAPCRSFATAISHTNSGGEVIVLDSAGYGAVVITQSVSLIAPAGIYAGVSVFSGAGISINAPGATVVLRGLSINSQGGLTGISLVAGAALHVENCEVSGFSGFGILTNSAGAVIHVIDSVVRDNSSGIVIGGSANVVATISRTRVENNWNEGIEISAVGDVDIDDSVVTGSQFNIDAYTTVASGFTGVTVTRTHVHGGTYGIIAEPLGANSLVQMSVNDCTVSDMSGFAVGAAPVGAAAGIVNIVRTHAIRNNFGFKADSTNGLATLVMENNTVMHNQQGVVATGASSNLRTRGNNSANNNTFLDVSGATTPITSF